MNKPDPQKVIHLKANQQRLPSSQQSQKPTAVQPPWEPHQSDQALDAWGVALRTLKEQGHTF
jgi:hypothetical protein